MGIGLRVIFIDQNEHLTKVPFALFDRLERGENASLPQFSNQRIRYALVFLNVHKRIIISISSIDYGTLAFNSIGAVNKELREKEFRLIKSPLDSLDDASEFDEDEYFRIRFKWKPSPRLERQIRTLALAR